MATAFLCSSSNSPPQSITPTKLHNQRTASTSTDLKTKTSRRQNNAAIAHALCPLVESGRMEEALSLFESAKKPDTFLWNVMIRGYTNTGSYEEAIGFYHRMRAARVRCDYFTFVFLIKSCAELSSYDEGLMVHGSLLKGGLDSDLFICNSLIAMYSKFGLIDAAERVFGEMPMKDNVSWNSMIGGYVSAGDERRALQCFREMQEGYGTRPDQLGLISALKACYLVVHRKEGKEIHCYVIRHGLESDIKVQTSLLDMYFKCRDMVSAERLFKIMSERNVVTWNVLIGGYAMNNQTQKAFDCAAEMQAGDIDPNVVTMVNLLSACEQLGSLSYGKTIHGMAIRRELLPHMVLETALIEIYAKCGELKTAKLLFALMNEKSLVSWNTTIAAHVQNGKSMEAVKLFIDLQRGPLEPDAFTISSIVPAYAELALLRLGRQIHSYALRSGYGSNTSVQNSIVYMYARCGDLRTSREVFDRMTCKDIISWNTVIMGYAIHGCGETALRLFSGMKDNGLQPNASTFVSVLTACSLSGLVEEGWLQFASMQQEYGICPQIEHYGCMDDLLGRTGDLKEAVNFIERMPMVPTAKIWGSLLTASRNCSNIEVAEFAAEQILALQHDNTGCYVVLSSMYADARRWEDLEKVRSLMKENGVQKTMARSLVELSGKTCSFANGDRSHVQTNTIHLVSDILSRNIGETAYDPNAVFSPEDIAAKKATSPNRHSVRLAVVLGLISTTLGSGILVKKNVRICNSCHRALKLISKFSNREIVVRDLRIYHHFYNGFCSCGDYW